MNTQRLMSLQARTGAALSAFSPLRVPALRKSTGLLACAGLWLVMGVISPGFATSDNLANIVSQSAVLLLLALGQMLVVVTRGFDISVGAVAVLSSIVITQTAAPFGEVPAILLGTGAGLAVGLCNGYLIACRRMEPIVVTLGATLIVRGVSTIISGGADAVPLPPGTVIQSLAYAAWLGVPAMVWLAAPVAALAWLLCTRLPLGRWFYMIGSNPDAALLVGVPVRTAGVLAYGLCGALAGLAAVFLLARSGAAVAVDGAGMELQAIAACVIGGVALSGGKGAVWQVMAGTLFIQALLNGLNLLGTSPFASEIVLGAVIVSAGLLEYLMRKVGSRQG